MKKLLLKSLAIIILITFYSCEEENAPIFVAQPDVNGIIFTNSFASNYLISEATKENIGDRLIWESADFGVTTNVTYEIQGSIDPTFSTFTIIGTTNENNFPVTISNFLDFAKELGLDADPSTTDSAGLANNVGQFFVRIKANVGTTDNLTTYSEFETINITWLEDTPTNTCNSLYVLGEGITDIGWNFPGIELTCDTNVLKAKARLGNANFRFFTTVGDWDSGLDYNYFENEGYTIDANLENAGDNFSFIGTPGIYTITIDDANKTIQLEASSSLWAVGDAVPGGWSFSGDTVEFIENTPDIWSASIQLNNNIFRFFQTFGTYDTNNNFQYYIDQGFTIDSNFESDGGPDANFNFIGTAGTYNLTINAVEKTITLN
ncbi:SusE domain-containing protein [Polaribacter vadi]|uniref:SusE domain-containing protein n=1 Tax=Polaribacter vadi TaxID=1774273 RepID=UPI0030EDB71D|tara:strand:- start:8589 stop:9719 length:1131 start_codon:yes stop_codon:yes gene_type:complete